MTHSINPAGLALIEEYEGCKLSAYPDSKGVPTIGYGHTRGVKLGESCSRTQAEQWLGEDLAIAEDTVTKHVTVPLTKNQFAALVAFAFNVGESNFSGSTLLRRLNEGFYANVPTYLRAWIFSGGKKIDGLVRRRAAEAALWSMP